MKKCAICGIMQFNQNVRSDDKYDDFCDVHYWKIKAFVRGEALIAILDGLKPRELLEMTGLDEFKCNEIFSILNDVMSEQRA